MRFAFVSTMADWSWGGSEELWSQTAVHLKNGGHDVLGYVAHWPRLSAHVDALRTQGVRIETYPSYRATLARRIWNRFSVQDRRSYSRLKRFRPDLVIISQGHNAGGFNWAAACRESSIPYVVIVHCNSEHWWFNNEQIGEARASYGGARKVFCVSYSNLNLLRMQLAAPVPNGEVVLNPYKVSPEKILPWPADDGTWRLACVARLDTGAKGQELLLQVLARPEWRTRPLQLNFFGEGPHEVALRGLADMLQLKQVHFCGQVSDVERIWEKNHMLVLPSRYEGLPLVLVEAMWCGRPAVVTDIAGNTEVCADGETGFVVPAPNVPLLANTLERAWERRQEWHRMGQAARERAERQIPRRPIPIFAEKLIDCAKAVHGEMVRS